MMSMFDVQDPSNQDRLAMVEVGARIVASDPLTGVGPNMVPRVYADLSAGLRDQPEPTRTCTTCRCRLRPSAVCRRWPSGRGSSWRWSLVALFRLFRRGHERVLAATALAAVAAMLAAGLFEYNFGDSEFLMLFLVLVTLPFAAMRTDGSCPRSDLTAAAASLHRSPARMSSSSATRCSTGSSSGA